MSIKNSELYKNEPFFAINNVCVGYSIVLYELLETHKDGYNDYMCGELVSNGDSLVLKNVRKCEVHYNTRTSPFIWKNKIRYYLRDFIKVPQETQNQMQEIIAG